MARTSRIKATPLIAKAIIISCTSMRLASTFERKEMRSEEKDGLELPKIRILH
jgi:hypothetical protein